MTPPGITALRLKNQQLMGSSFKKPEELVAWMGAVQAQDYAGAKWAVGVRTIDTTDSSIECAIDKGKIIRTHVLRPTWHLVNPADIRWMLMFTAPRIHAFAAFGYRQMGLNDAIFKRANKALTKALQGGKHLTRIEIAAVLQQAKIQTDELRLIHILMHAELDAVICNGPRKGKQFTYALLDERIPQTKTIKPEEALIKLTTRYFKSHGPATLADYAWWSGLTTRDAQKGLELVKSALISEVVNGTSYWMTSDTAAIKNKSGVLLLPAFDEYTVAYKDRSLVLDETAAKQTGNGIFKPLLLIDGQVKGYWKRNDKKDSSRVDLTLFDKLSETQTKKITAEIKKYSSFLACIFLYLTLTLHSHSEF
jgi:hypothetical protein